ncbi:unnamed protein product, partial [Choristocarpus tenellus]
VGRAKWRPGHLNHICTTSYTSDPEMMVYDITRPFVPLVVLGGGSEVKSGFCWCDTPALP